MAADDAGWSEERREGRKTGKALARAVGGERGEGGFEGGEGGFVEGGGDVLRAVACEVGHGW